YYESLSLLKCYGRTEGGYRQFSEDVLTRLAFIKRAQNLDLSLEEIGDILNVYDKGKPACSEIQQKLKQKQLEIDNKIDELLALRNELGELLSDWKNLQEKPEDKICPIIQKNQ
ncbi:MAG: MerR family DNA-binding protein, partial [Nostocaceae cyanobacterium]|nr:MerR family DNA-binding protein [Nostocaceae cyanobacterium]